MYYNSNQQMLNNLERQKENINNLIAQYSQPAPVQNIINTNPVSELEAKILNKGEDPNNIAVTRKTFFISESNKKVYIKDVDGTITKEYEIVIPLDEKDKKIMELDARIRKMEEIENAKYTELNKSDDVIKQPITVGNELTKPTTKAVSKTSTKSTKWKTSTNNSRFM